MARLRHRLVPGSQSRAAQPYYRQLRQTAFANFQQGWPTRATEALGGSDQITPDGLHSIAIRPRRRHDVFARCARGSPRSSAACSKAAKSSTTCSREVYRGTREEFINSTGEWVAEKYGPSCNDRWRAGLDCCTGEPAGESYFLPAGSGSRHVIFPGVEIQTTAGKNLMLSVVRFEPARSWPSTPIPTNRWASCSRAGSSSRSAPSPV